MLCGCCLNLRLNVGFFFFFCVLCGLIVVENSMLWVYVVSNFDFLLRVALLNFIVILLVCGCFMVWDILVLAY